MFKVRPRQSRHYRYEPPSRRGQGALEFWAENGLIFIVDERFAPADPQSLEVVTVREWLENISGINTSIPRLSERIVSHVSVNMAGGSAGGSIAEERESLHKLVEDGCLVAKEAQRQGRPDDPKHVAQMARDRRRSMVQAGTGGARSMGAISASDAPEGQKLGKLWFPGRDGP